MSEDYYNFSYTIVQEADIPRSIILWNMLDFGHVNFVHKSSYKYCKVLAKQGNVTLLEYGANQFLNKLFPFTVKHTMWHQFNAPGTITHLSKNHLTGAYTKVRMEISEFVKDGKKHSRIEHTFWFHLPFFIKPFKGIITKYLERWSEQLWQEDLEMCRRRQEALEGGFKDNPMDTLPRAKEGLLR